MLKKYLKLIILIGLLPIICFSQTKTATEGYVNRTVVPLSRTVYVDKEGKGQFTNITAALAWVDTQHITDPTGYYKININIGEYTEDVTIKAFTIISGTSARARTRIIGSTTFSGQPSTIENIYFYGNTQLPPIRIANIDANNNNIITFFDCLVVETINFAGPTYCVLAENNSVIVNVRFYYSDIYSANTGSSPDTKNVIFCTTNNSTLVALENYATRLKSSSSGNHTNSYLGILNGDSFVEVFSGGWDVFHDASPKMHANDTSRFEFFGSYYNEEAYGAPFIIEGNSSAIPIVKVQPLRTMFILETPNEITINTNVYINATLSAKYIDPVSAVFNLNNIITIGDTADTVTVTRAMGTHLIIDLTKNTVFEMNMDTYPTNLHSKVTIDINPRVYSATFSTGMEGGLVTLTPNTWHTTYWTRGSYWPKFKGTAEVSQ